MKVQRMDEQLQKYKNTKIRRGYMNTKYRLGRSAFRTLEEGMEKEWLVTNGIGSFANGSVTGANHRLFSSYLIASFHPPVDRKVIWSGTHEKLVSANQREVDLTASRSAMLVCV